MAGGGFILVCWAFVVRPSSSFFLGQCRTGQRADFPLRPKSTVTYHRRVGQLPTKQVARAVTSDKNGRPSMHHPFFFLHAAVAEAPSVSVAAGCASQRAGLGLSLYSFVFSFWRVSPTHSWEFSRSRDGWPILRWTLSFSSLPLPV